MKSLLEVVLLYKDLLLYDTYREIRYISGGSLLIQTKLFNLGDKTFLAQSAGAAEYTDSISAEG